MLKRCWIIIELQKGVNVCAAVSYQVTMMSV